MSWDGTGPPTSPRTKRTTRAIKIDIYQDVYDKLDELSEGEPGLRAAHLVLRYTEHDGKCGHCGADPLAVPNGEGS